MQKTFDEVVLFARTGLNPRQNFKLGQGNNYYITIKNIKNNSLVIDDNTDVVNDEAIKLIHKRSQIKKGDILFASIGRMGDMYIIEEEPMVWDINESVFAFTLDTSIVRQKYFYYIFRVKSTLDYLASNSSGSTFKSIKMNQLKKMKFEIPALDKQDQIVAVLDKICNIIEMRKQELGSLDDLIKARFVEMFGDININDKNWNCEPLGELCTIVRGGSPRPIEQFLGGDVPWIKIGDATDGDNIYLNSTKEHIIQEGVKKSRLVKPGSLIFANCGVSLGFARIITFEGCIHDGWLAMEDIDERLDRVFLLQALNQMTEYFRTIAPAGTQPNLNTAIMKAYMQVIPPIELQRDYIRFVHQVDKSKVAVQKALDETQTLFDSLMQEYFG